MTKHDSWVYLEEGSPYDAIAKLFPNGYPVRDPFAMATATDVNGRVIPLWIIDLERLNPMQIHALGEAIALKSNSFYDEVIDEAIQHGGFALNAKWVNKLECGPEGTQRSKELADYFEANPTSNPETFQQFCNDQVARWIEGNEKPPPIEAIDDIDPRLRTPELEKAMVERKVKQMLAEKGYSVLDVMLGEANDDIRKIIDEMGIAIDVLDLSPDSIGDFIEVRVTDDPADAADGYISFQTNDWD